MYKLLRLDTGEFIELNDYYQGWLNMDSIAGLRRKYNLYETSFGYCFIQKGSMIYADPNKIILGYLLELIEVPYV